jgi:hypothetical protein
MCPFVIPCFQSLVFSMISVPFLYKDTINIGTYKQITKFFLTS